MANVGTFAVRLIDVNLDNVTDPNATVRFNGNGMKETSIKGCALPRDFAGLPAFPQANNIICRVWLTRFRSTKSGFFTLKDGQTIQETLMVWKKPTEWTALFDPWDQLPNRFRSMKRALTDSPELKDKPGRKLGRFVESAYDNSHPTTALSKAGLLNIYTKMSKITAPTPEGKRWFTYVKSILQIAPDRIIAVVDEAMGEAVKMIRKDINRYPDYEKAGSDLHHKNFPKNYQVSKGAMFSVKTTENLGNLQLTMAPARDPNGNEVLLLDADIDENGKLLQHILDVVFRHPFNGGTHPFDIHQILAYQDREDAFGFKLV
jgi:hypothetical protein